MLADTCPRYGGPAGQQFRGAPAQSTAWPVASSFWCRWCCGGPHPFDAFSILLCHHFSPKKKSVSKEAHDYECLKGKDCLQPRASGWYMAKLGPTVRGGHTRKVCQTLQDSHFQDRHRPFSHYPGGGREENNLRAVSQSNRIPDFMQPLSPSGPR